MTVAKVIIWDNFVGAVAWDENRGYATFEFDKEFLKTGWDLSPLKMPVEKVRAGEKIFSFPSLNKETYRGLPGLLADSLPDKFGNRVIEAWLAQQGRDADDFNSVERLCYTGKRGMGALEYEPILSPVDNSSNPLMIKELVSLAKKILSERKNLQVNIHDEADRGLLDIIRVSTSAGGARAKAVIAYNEKTGEVRSGQIDGLNNFDYWILKFDGVSNKLLGDPKGYGRIEYAYYLMAIECGIKMKESKLLKENRRAHFMTKRFDRDGAKKVHMQTLCGIAHFDYNDSDSYSYEQAFQTLRQLKLSYGDMEELFKRMVFNVIARNHDDHTKNISFLMDETGNWSLAPAYDLTYAFDPKNKWMKAHQMSINGKNEDIDRNDILNLAKIMNIKKPGEHIERIRNAVGDWAKYAKQAGVKTDQIKSIEKVLLIKI